MIMIGRYDFSPDWAEILVYFRGSELQNYFTKILEGVLFTARADSNNH